MRWIDFRSKMLVATGLLLLLGAAPSANRPGPLLMFSKQATVPIDIFEIDGKDYVDLAAVLYTLGPVSSETTDKEQRLWFRKIFIRFGNEEVAGTIGRNRFQLTAPFILQDGRGLVPLRSLPAMLAQLLDERVDYHDLSRRIFLADSATHFSPELKKSGTLVLNFSGRVNPQIAAEGTTLRLLFSRDGVTSATQSWNFQDAVVSSATYTETEAGPEMTISGSEPLLATFADNGHSISITAAPKAPVSATAQTALPAAAPEPTASALPPAPAAAAAPPPPAPEQNAPATPAVIPSIATAPRSRLLIIIDAAHGGEERGAALTDRLAEKDVTLAIARRLHTELENRGIPSFMLRDGDSTMALDQRATLANSLHGALYLAIHAGTLGKGMRVYTSMLAAAAPAQGLLPWETAQASFVTASQRIASIMVDEMGRRALDFPVVLLPAPVRPLNNIAGAGVAVEVAPQRRDPDTLSDSDYQQAVAAALANAIVAAHPEAMP